MAAYDISHIINAQQTAEAIIRGLPAEKQKPPINPFDIAETKGIKVLGGDFKEPNVYGIIIKEGDDVSIYARYSDSTARQRFTIAHELGHYFLHLANRPTASIVESDTYYKREIENGGPPYSKEEQEANAFAAALLMPKFMIDDVVKYVGGNIPKLANIFGVSEAAMAYRMKSLYVRNLIPNQ